MLVPGTRVGGYEIVAKIGEGGMGEVYRARDSRLHRDVALKVLAHQFAAEPTRLARFAQEARAAAALNHPNILAIYDAGTHERQPFLVSELLEGHSVRELLRDGPIPIRKALDYAVQITTGLAAAHDRGIVHRDLKPENLFITSDGRAKVLDFGIAKLLDPPDDADTLATELSPRTDAGIVLGTAGYMSPEQIRGGAVDHRTDVFAFGATLFEMLSGTRPFAASTSADTMSAVLSREPAELTTPGGAVPPAVDRIVRRCLEKQPEHRFQSARDLAFAIDAMTLGTGGSHATDHARGSAPAARASARELVAWALVALIAAAALTLALRPAPAAAPPLATRFSLEFPFDLTGISIATAVSPDGHWFAVSVPGVPGDAIMVRRRDGDSFIRISDTDEARLLGWTPDSRSITVARKGELRLIDISGAGSRVLASLPATPSVQGAAWSGSGEALLWLSGAPLHILRSGATAIEPLSSLDASVNETEQGLPVFLPDGRRFFYTSFRNGQFATRLRSLDSNKVQDFNGVADSIIWAGERHVVFRRGATLQAQAVSYDPLELRAAPIQLVSDVFVGPVSRSAYVSAGASASAIMYRRDQEPPRQFTWFARDGRRLNPVGAAGFYMTFSLSEDGRRLIASRRDSGVHNLWSFDAEKGTVNRVTAGSASDVDPRLSPDGRLVVFASTRDPRRSPFKTTIAGDEPQRVFPFKGGLFALDDWSSDGQWLLFRNAGTPVLEALRLDRPDDEPIVAARALAGIIDQATMSPDGRWVAYNSTESGRAEVYVVPFPPTGDKWQISDGGGAQPQWRRDTGELYFLTLDGTLTAVLIDTTKGFRFKDPVALFRAPLPAVNSGIEQYAPAPDGTRFLFLHNTENATMATVAVLANWSPLVEREP
jgi:tRNA A-37 threonylcarbamoyl transferase component Bud32